MIPVLNCYSKPEKGPHVAVAAFNMRKGIPAEETSAILDQIVWNCGSGWTALCRSFASTARDNAGRMCSHQSRMSSIRKNEMDQSAEALKQITEKY